MSETIATPTGNESHDRDFAWRGRWAGGLNSPALLAAKSAGRGAFSGRPRARWPSR
jgi:hypothetical protein